MIFIVLMGIQFELREIKRLGMDAVTIIGVSASIFTIAPLLPSLIKLVKERKTRRVSIPLFISISAGLLLWILYGFLKSDWIILLSNLLALTFTLVHNLLVIHYKRKARKRELHLLYYR
jgi:MtN3 and saliva related transmembrane protein